MRVVAALGGNALSVRGEPIAISTQRVRARRAAAALAALVEGPEHATNELVVTHGNGPQVGWLAAQAAAHRDQIPLDVLVAESDGLIGYLIDQELTSALPHRQIATLLTQTLVDPSDPAFQRPDKPIGPVLPREHGAELTARGLPWAPDGEGIRRVVASPAPIGFVEAPTLRLLIEHQVIVICTGGGGIPVALGPELRLHGVEAVVDKDAASERLARELDAEVLLMLTDVDAVYEGWPERARPIRRIAASALDPGRFAAGSMRPKVQAARAFASTGRRAVIGAMDQAAAMLRGEAGTEVVPG